MCSFYSTLGNRAILYSVGCGLSLKEEEEQYCIVLVHCGLLLKDDGQYCIVLVHCGVSLKEEGHYCIVLVHCGISLKEEEQIDR